MKHIERWGAGLRSFALGMVSENLVFLTLVIIAAGQMTAPQGKQFSGATVFGLFLIGSLALSLVAFILGAVGVTRWDDEKVFAILGMAISGITVVGTILLMIVGTAMKHH